ncbi:MAG: glycosyltransferase family 4 protein [Acidobacteria bacterium]|nr:glycosyltransferase family 4 protein [Acidobacteriota bacterium]
MAKIMIMTPSHSAGGGVERILEDVQRTLHQAGHDVWLALPRSRLSDPADFLALHDTGLAVVEVPVEATTRGSRIRQLSAFLRRESPDLLINARVFDLYPAVAALKNGHSSAPRMISMIYSYEAALLWDLRGWSAVIDGVAVDAKLIADAASDLAGYPTERIERLPGPVQAPHRLRSPRKKKIRIGYVGRLQQRQKRVLDILPFMAQLDRLGIDYEMTIAGSGTAEGELRERLALEHSRNVHFLGWQSREQLYGSVYPELDILVHFAEWEGVTIAPREAMAHGVVPVISRFTALEHEGFFRDGQNALVFDPGDVERAAAHVRALDDDGRFLEELSAAAVESRRGIYSSEGVFSLWCEFVDRILDLPIRAAPAEQLPDLPSSGRLQALGIPDRVAEWLRNVTRWKNTIRRPSDEWPHTSGTAPHEWSERLHRFALGEGNR